MQKLFLDPADLDNTINPGTDFYRYANGGWITRHPIPPDESRFGTFDLLSDQTKENLRILFMDFEKGNYDESDPSINKIVDFFRTGLDKEKANALGTKPIDKYLKRISGITDIARVQEEITIMHGHGLSPLFNFYGSPDMKNSGQVIAEFYQGGLGLSDRDYYLGLDFRSEKIRTEYRSYIQQLFILLGYHPQESRDRANHVMDIETALAEKSFSRLDQRDPHKNYHKTGYEGLVNLCPNFSWESFFSLQRLDKPEEINIAQPEFLTEVSVLLQNISVAKWKTYLEWNWINGLAPYLSEDFICLHFEFFGKILSGKIAIQPRWKRVVQDTNQALSMLVGKYYVQKYFPPSSRERMLLILKNLRTAMKRRIQNLDWMTDITKEKALYKLEKIVLKIGYPDEWKDYTELEINTDSFADNVIRSLAFEHNYNVSKIGKPVDTSEWGMSPQTVNAYYNPSQNEIVFPAAILQPPFFHPDADDAINYGAIGMIIGHEMTHGFDDQGRHFNASGNLEEWWTAEDSESFKARTQILIDQFNGFIVHDEVRANGELTLGENIADLGGLNIALAAYLESLPDPENPPEAEGFTGIQRFFIAYARVWANTIREEEILRRTREDVHSLGELRVNGPLPNIDLFCQAFNIGAGQELFIDPSLRAHIW